ncbi:MAG TPA: carbohydrate ABC transporter permease [Clostridiales bacterium]|nr:carbohydrate ABC transporter permease [Clostridiales bacterium]
MSISAIKRNTVSQIIINIFFILLSVSFITPLFAIISISLTSERDVVNYGYSLIPPNIDFSAYKFILSSPSTILSAYKVTAITSFIGVLSSLLISSMCAFSLSRKDFKYRRQLTFYFFFTMLFNGGLVPYYILMTKYLSLRNTYLALILPLIGNIWHMLILRTFFQSLMVEIIESATIDGASDVLIYAYIALPLSTPALATIGLFQLLSFWNSWYPALLFITKKSLYPLQYLLQSMLRNAQEIIRNMEQMSFIAPEELKNVPTESTRMAMCIIAIGPILFIFPFFQKYFVKGLTIGAVKG